MNRPNRVGNSGTLRGYAVAPALAFSGWRLSVPGEPDGGQYHGYIGPDSTNNGWPAGTDEIGNSSTPQLSGGSLTPWDHLWSGIALREGQNLSDYVYRSPSEMRPRANASGGANVVRSFQRRRTPGAALAPGNYKALGFVGMTVLDAIHQGIIPDPCNDSPATWAPTLEGFLASNPGCLGPYASMDYATYTGPCLKQDANFSCPGDEVLVTGPAPCFTKGCASGRGYTTGPVPTTTQGIDVGNGLRLLSCPQLNVICGPGMVSVPGPAPCYTRYCVPADSTDLPVDTVAPAPQFYTEEIPQAVPVTTSVVMTAPPLTSTAAPAGSSSASVSDSVSVSGIEAWLQSSSLISGVPNMYIAGAAAVAAFFLFSGSDGKKKSR